jgi:hypothetical protein
VRTLIRGMMWKPARGRLAESMMPADGALAARSQRRLRHVPLQRAARRNLADFSHLRNGSHTQGPCVRSFPPSGLVRFIGPRTTAATTRRAPCRGAAWNRGLHCTLTVEGLAGVCPVQSQIVNYRAKAKEFARLTVVAKSLRHSRQYRKLAEMYWALALGEEPDRAQPSKPNLKRNTT